MRGAVFFLFALSCASEPARTEVVHLSDVNGRVSLEIGAETTIEIHSDGVDRILEIAVVGGEATLDDDPGEVRSGGTWFRPRLLSVPVVSLLVHPSGETPATVTIADHGPDVPLARRERSIVWTDPLIVDDPGRVGLGRVLGAASPTGEPGVLLDNMLRRFATTAHSERAAPAQFADELAAAHGSDPSLWDVDQLPFLVTGVHNRIDLAARNGACGELRVSFASTHPVYAPFHMIVLFRQPPDPVTDVIWSDVHCLGAYRRWGRLSGLDGAEFAAAAAELLDDVLVNANFLMIETVELTISPWEWRQWAPQAEPNVLDNPPLFQTLDTETLNPSGPLRTEFIDWVLANAAALDARTIEIPARFRAASARVNPGVPREPIDLGVPAEVLEQFPELAEHAEIVGCPACHTTDAEFVQTDAQRRFSPFYDREIDVRNARLQLINRGFVFPDPPFGPLQPQ